MSNTSSKSNSKSSKKSKDSIKLDEMYGNEVGSDSESAPAMPYANIHVSQNKVADFKVNEKRLISAMIQMIERRDKGMKKASSSSRASERDKIERVTQEELERNLATVLTVNAVGASAVAKHTKHFSDYATIENDSIDKILKEMNDHANKYSVDYRDNWMSVRSQSIIRSSISNHLKAFNAVSSVGGFTYTDLSSCQVLRYYPQDFLGLVNESASKFRSQTMNLPPEIMASIDKLNSGSTPVSSKYDSLSRDWFAQAPYIKHARAPGGDAILTTRMVQNILTCMIRHAELEGTVKVYKTCTDKNKLVNQHEVTVFDLKGPSKQLGVDLIKDVDSLFPPKPGSGEGKVDKPPRNVYLIDKESVLGKMILLANKTSKSDVSDTWRKMYMHNDRYVYKSASLSNDLEMRLRGVNVSDKTDPLSTAVNQYLNMTNLKMEIDASSEKEKTFHESPYVLIREGLGKGADVGKFLDYYNQATVIFKALAMLSVACELNKHIFEGKKIYNTKERNLTGRTKKKYTDGTKSSKRGKSKSGEAGEAGDSSSGSDDDDSSSSDGEDSE